ncbi:hypothetical protein RHO12_02945 [Orbus sturtevantii]|uniref:hypothetical protein n=1 Tax=Orbus sturtevantii TaxID=3074109 RepID=UPI00370D6676
MSKTKVMVEFMIYGDDFSSDSITNLLGIKPTRKNKRIDTRRETEIIYQYRMDIARTI